MSNVPPPLPDGPELQLQPKKGMSTGAILAIVFGVLAMLAVPFICLLLGILLPALGKAREIANRAVCSANMNGIYKSMYTYSVTNDDQFPPNLGILIMDGSISVNTVLCPSAGVNISAMPGDMTLQEMARWADANTPYIYVYPNEGSNASSDAIIMYEPLENHAGDGMNILWGDGHVSFETDDQAFRILRKQGLDPHGGRHRGHTH